MKREAIESAFVRLNELLRARKVKGEVAVVGGTAMVLVFDSREATKDVDAVFKPAADMRKAAAIVAEERGLPKDWLNDGVKGFFSRPPSVGKILMELDSLLVYRPPLEQLLAMKAISARYDSHDADDVRTLCAALNLKTVGQVEKVISDYYPRNRVPPKTLYFLEEVLEGP